MPDWTVPGSRGRLDGCVGYQLTIAAEQPAASPLIRLECELSTDAANT